ncbi:uncharacterized protein B0T15DRAFT_103549 [Chaetomium strumarium]|uniref:J domain-containing protein n=1 Tax=Chaetomium strumarium TaxID=1170767 RepID=A0AAJ0M4A3_9PEZI|nr:hypothetical protein B0T15DRAFT_103549 [Chaetomium strumarium]
MTSTLPPDPWKALGVERHADKSEIRSAYKKLVLKCHPDKVQDPTQKALKQEEFQKVQQAYELLNNDAEKAKYEQKLQLAELQRAAAKVHQDAKNSPNTSVPRSSTRYATYDIRTAEPTSRYKSSPSGGKVYTHYTTTHTRSHEEMPSTRSYPLYEESDKAARKSAGYEKPSKRDEERRERDREERRRRREDEELLRQREKERDRERERERDRERERERDRERERAEKEREARKAEKKRIEKEREKERRRDVEDKARRHKPYVEPYEAAYVEDLLFEDEKFVTSRSEKKRSSSRKHDEARERERERERDRDRDRERERDRDKSNSRRAKSPHLSSDQKLKHMEEFERAKLYMSSAGSSVPEKTAFWISQTPPDSYLTPPVPSPPPAVDLEEDSIRHAAARAAGRRSSNDPARSREKLSYNLDATARARPIPNLTKSYSTPPPAPESPPRVSRSQTTPHESYARPIPAPLQRGATWAAGGIDERHLATDYLDDYDSDDGRERRHRRSRRTRSPSVQAASRYKVEGAKTSKIDSHYSSSKLESPYVYGDSPSSTRRYAAAEVLARSPSSTYAGAPFKVKEAPVYGPDDVKYSEYAQPSYYSAARTPA